jgi:hypothetical protein
MTLTLTLWPNCTNLQLDSHYPFGTFDSDYPFGTFKLVLPWFALCLLFVVDFYVLFLFIYLFI